MQRKFTLVRVFFRDYYASMWERTPYIALNFRTLTNNVHEYYIFCKMCGYPQFSSWISVTLVKIYISCLIINHGKNTFELVDTISIVLSKIAVVVILVKTGFFSEFLKYGFSAPQVGERKTGIIQWTTALTSARGQRKQKQRAGNNKSERLRI